MFQKPFKVKSNTQLKGSERKKLRLEILKHFPTMSATHLDAVLSSKQGVNAMKLSTHKHGVITAYCKSADSFPLFFEYGDHLFPTVYVMWQFLETAGTEPIPSILTSDGVLSKLLGGADLMLPGVLCATPCTQKCFPCLPRGAPVSISTNLNKAAFAIGRTVRSSEDLIACGKKGKCVEVLHTVGDTLWLPMEDRPCLPQLGPPDLAPEDSDGGTGSDCSEVEQMLELNQELLNVNLNDEEEEVDRLDVADDGQSVEEQEVLCDAQDAACDGQEDSASPQQAQDELLRYCFLKAWRLAGNKVQLPLLTSNFFRLHMIPACPASHAIDVKKSSYKKLSVFLMAMVKEEIIKIKEQVKGVETIAEVNLEHPEIRGFRRWLDDVPEDKAGAKVDAKTAPNIVELYKITANVLPIFKDFNHKKGDSLTAQTVRQHVTDYVKHNNLQDPADPRLVTVDPVLHDALQAGSEKMTWEELMQNCLSRMTQTYHLTATGPLTVKKQGKLEPIDIRVSMRSGNKKVTLVNNLELFGIVCQDFARKCQHGVAASTSISSVPGKKSAQVLVQGNQVDFIGKLLLSEYKIPVRYIRGLENAPTKKKSKGKK